MVDWPLALSITAIVFGFMSACAWLRASVVKVGVEETMAKRKKQAERAGIPISHGYVALDDWEMSETFKAQSRWNATGALLAAASITLQALSQVLS